MPVHVPLELLKTVDPILAGAPALIAVISKFGKTPRPDPFSLFVRPLHR